MDRIVGREVLTLRAIEIAELDSYQGIVRDASVSLAPPIGTLRDVRRREIVHPITEPCGDIFGLTCFGRRTERVPDGTAENTSGHMVVEPIRRHSPPPNLRIRSV